MTGKEATRERGYQARETRPARPKLRCLRWFKDGNITGKRVFEEGEVAEFPKPIARQLLAQRGAWEVVK